jgi:hypothetical protein
MDINQDKLIWIIIGVVVVALLIYLYISNQNKNGDMELQEVRYVRAPDDSLIIIPPQLKPGHPVSHPTYGILDTNEIIIRYIPPGEIPIQHIIPQIEENLKDLCKCGLPREQHSPHTTTINHSFTPMNKKDILYTDDQRKPTNPHMPHSQEVPQPRRDTINRDMIPSHIKREEVKRQPPKQIYEESHPGMKPTNMDSPMFNRGYSEGVNTDIRGQ